MTQTPSHRRGAAGPWVIAGPGHCPVCPELSAGLPDATLRGAAQPRSADKVPAELIPAPPARPPSPADPAPTPPGGAARGPFSRSLPASPRDQARREGGLPQAPAPGRARLRPPRGRARGPRVARPFPRPSPRRPGSRGARGAAGGARPGAFTWRQEARGAEGRGAPVSHRRAPARTSVRPRGPRARPGRRRRRPRDPAQPAPGAGRRRGGLDPAAPSAWERRAQRGWVTVTVPGKGGALCLRAVGARSGDPGGTRSAELGEALGWGAVPAPDSGSAPGRPGRWAGRWWGRWAGRWPGRWQPRGLPARGEPRCGRRSAAKRLGPAGFRGSLARGAAGVVWRGARCRREAGGGCSVGVVGDKGQSGRAGRCGDSGGASWRAAWGRCQVEALPKSAPGASGPLRPPPPRHLHTEPRAPLSSKAATRDSRASAAAGPVLAAPPTATCAHPRPPAREHRPGPARREGP